MTSKGNQSWNLESFLDSLIYELDQAQDKLSVKGVNRKLTYTVKDMALELNIFPEFDGDTVRFTTAKPGDTGASKISLQLGSIRDNQIREVTREPLTQSETSLEEIDIPESQRKELKKLGIHSAEDLQHTVENQGVDLEQATQNKVSYQQLAERINQARRKQRSPQVSKASISKAQGETILTLQGENLAIAQSLDQFPLAAINNQPVEVISANAKEVKIRVNDRQLQASSNQLQIALDPYAIITMNLQT
jgi:hypothetical protein